MTELAPTTVLETPPLLNEHRIYQDIYEIFESEFIEIGKFIAFTNENMSVYSNKVHELHLRVCSEIENILKIVIHRHFVDKITVNTLFSSKKSAFLKKNDEYIKAYTFLKSELNRSGKEDLDANLFGFSDFSFYFEIASEKFNLNRKLVVFLVAATTSEGLSVVQPFETETGRVVPKWWTNYNKLKHNKIENYSSCTLGDLRKSLAGLYILMNYLTKYLGKDKRTFDSNYFIKYPEGNNNGCDYWQMPSKIFRASNFYQSSEIMFGLPTQRDIRGSEYKSICAKYGKPLREIFDTASDPENPKSFQVKQNCIFYTYFDYFEYADRDSYMLFYRKERFGEFAD